MRNSEPGQAHRPFVILRDAVPFLEVPQNCGPDPPITLDVARGEFVSLVGIPDAMGLPFLRMVAGLRPPSSGRVEINGSAPVPGRFRCGLVFRSPVLLEWRSTLNNVLLASELGGIDSSTEIEQATRLLAIVGLEEARALRPSQLGNADARKVCLCRALQNSPELLLMDDPFDGLGQLDREQCARDLQRLLAGTATTVLMITSGIDEAVRLSDRVAVAGGEGIVQSVAVDLPRPRLHDEDTDRRIAEYADRLRVLLAAHGLLT